MKMKIFALLCVIAVSVLAFAACNGDNKNDPDHVHTFSETWMSDAKSHWHRATCEHGEVKDSLADHVDVDEDGKCDVCEYEVGHDHTYELTWTYDDEYHWRKATCTHTNERASYALHSDEDDNGVCDICRGHVHNANAAGYCKHEGCGKKVSEVDVTSLEAIVNAIFVQRHLVNGYTAKYFFNTDSNNPDYQAQSATGSYWTSYKRSVEKDISVLFGKDGFVYNKTDTNNIVGSVDIVDGVEVPSKGYSTSVGAFESWTEPVGNSVFTVYTEDEGELKLDSPDENKLNGSYYSVPILAGGYGTEEFLYNLFLVSQSETTSDLVCNIVNNTVTLSFDYLNVQETNVSDNAGSGSATSDADVEYSKIYNVNYFVVEISFTFTDDFALTRFDFKCEIFSNDAGTLYNNQRNYADVSLQYDPDTKTVKFVKYNPDLPGEEEDKYEETDSPMGVIYQYSVTQTIGERTAENPNTQSKFVPESFDVFSDKECTEEIVDKYNMTAKTFARFYLGNCAPEGTSFDFAPSVVSCKVYDADGNEITGIDTVFGDSEIFRADFTLDGDGRHFLAYPKVAGTYTFVICINGSPAYQFTIIATNS